jgi:hypothetical protein
LTINKSIGLARCDSRLTGITAADQRQAASSCNEGVVDTMKPIIVMPMFDLSSESHAMVPSMLALSVKKTVLRNKQPADTVPSFSAVKFY